MKNVKKYLPFIVSLVLVIALVLYAPWDEIHRALKDFDIDEIGMLLVMSAIYHGLKAGRFWYILRAMHIRQPRALVALAYMTAQPISLLPGGEVYRSHALRRFTGVPVKKSIGQFTLQGLLEGGAMAIIMVISALALGKLRIPALILLALVTAAVISIRRGHLVNAGQALNKLPFVNISWDNIDNFSKRNHHALSWPWLPGLLGISLVIELVGTAIAYFSVTAIGGHINIFQAALLYVIPIIAGFISFLPGGIGVSEQSAVGVLLLSDTSVATAVTATLIMRLTIVGLGVIYGLLCGLAGQYYLRRRH